MFASNHDRKRELECLRLASDLKQLACNTLNPDLKAHCLLMVACSGKFSLVVLVVQDESLLRTLAVEVVEEAGFVALEASNAGSRSPAGIRSDIAMLFTDIDMSGSMDGLKLAHAVRGRWPPIKILLVSGQIRLQSSELPSNSRFVGKPSRRDNGRGTALARRFRIISLGEPAERTQ
jgi:two-component system, response regulator PdtaR